MLSDGCGIDRKDDDLPRSTETRFLTSKKPYADGCAPTRAVPPHREKYVLPVSYSLDEGKSSVPKARRLTSLFRAALTFLSDCVFPATCNPSTGDGIESARGPHTWQIVQRRSGPGRTTRASGLDDMCHVATIPARGPRLSRPSRYRALDRSRASQRMDRAPARVQAALLMSVRCGCSLGFEVGEGFGGLMT